MNLLEALKLCMENGIPVKAKHWKKGKVVFTADESNMFFPNKRFYYVFHEIEKLLPLYLTEQEDFFDEWEIVED